MSDFIMTMSSDDEQPSAPVASTSKKSAASAKQLTRKQQQQQQAKKNKLQALAKQKNKKSQRKAVNDISSASDEDDDDDSDAAEQVNGADEEGGKMAKDFVFDGLGGGFVGERRNNVWDGGESYLVKRPNAIPRVTVDEIIARRAPERENKVKKRAERKAVEQVEGGDDEADELETEMMADLEDEFGGDSDDEDQAESAGSAEDDDDDDEEEEGVAGNGEIDADSSVFGDATDDEEDWLGLGDDAEDEDAETAQLGTADAPTGFAALAAYDGELPNGDDGDSDAGSAEDIPLDLVEPSAPSAKDPDEAERRAAKAYFTAHSNAATSSSTALSFSTLPGCTISRTLLLALGSLNLSKPTPIQRECIPVAMMGKDIVASSATGSGKTVAFWVGVLERLLHRDRKHPATRVVVMTPTRELAVQVHGVGKALARYTDIQFCLCVGGLSLKVQESELKQRPDVVVSTPGRLIDHVRNTPCFTMDAVEILVLDEADRMLEEGFRDELEEIITAAPRSRQTLLFSATVTESVASLSRLSMNKPVRVKIDEMGATAQGLVQEFLRVRGDKAGEAIERGFRSGERHREALLVALCTHSFSSGRTIIFFRSKAQAHRMKIIFSLHGEGLERSDELHGDLTQEQRLLSLQKFREGESAFLLATDLASRGLDIKGIENVINYEMPRSIEIYLHRVGRTARAGKKGRALTLVGESDRKLVKLAMKHAPPETIKQRVIPPDVINAVSNELKDMEGEVKAVQREEKEEKEFRRSDMEITKGRNLIEHESEIKARPARTWFQTEQEKKIAKSLGITEHNSKFTDRGKKRPAEDELEKPKQKRAPLAGLSRKEKRRKMAAMEDAEDREEGTNVKIEASIRSAKKAARPTKMGVIAPQREKGMTPKKKKKGGSKFEHELGRPRADGQGAKKKAADKKREDRASPKKGGRGGKAGGGKRR